jgi:hypothetical protein
VRLNTWTNMVVLLRERLRKVKKIMDGKKEITLELHHEKSALMDELCDVNDFDRIVSLC